MANSVSLVESNQIIEDLYMNYIKNIKIPECSNWYLEYFPNSKETAVCLKRINDVPVLEQYITGGYKAELSFTVSFQASTKDTRRTLNITKPLNDLAATFEEETKQEFPNLKLRGATPIKLEMTSTPVDDSGENNKMAIFIAAYKLTFYKKGAFE